MMAFQPALRASLTDLPMTPTINYLSTMPFTDAAWRERVLRWVERLGLLSPGQIDVNGKRPGYDVSVVFRVMNQFGQGFPERKALRASPLGIYELDDGIFLDNGRLPGLGKWWKPLIAKSRVSHRAAQNADRIIAGNDLIAEWASQWCRDVRVIPTCVEPTAYDPPTAQLEGHPPTFVWIGSAATLLHLWSIKDQLVTANRETGSRLVVIGPPQADIPQELRPFTAIVPWTHDVTARLGSFGHLGLMPLPDNPYEQHKCAYKLLQYGAAQMQTIGSPVGMSARVLAELGGLAPATPSEWTDALVAAARMTASEVAATGLQARSAVTEHYSFERWEPEYRSAIGV
jgi:hypothetical protein